MDCLQESQCDFVAESDVPRFLNDLARRLNDFQLTEERINHLTAENFSCFRYIDLNENKSSAILADLLDPQGLHGQGRLFLDAFLKLCERETGFFSSAASIKVKTEASTMYIKSKLRRMDILLSDGKNVMAVENKLYAPDQKGQIEDYLHNIQFDASQCFMLVYLTPQGKLPSESSLTVAGGRQYKENIHHLSWGELLLCLEQCRKQLEAEKLRFFLKDFIAAMNYAIRWTTGERQDDKSS
ncbi:PD-(D/E)XK nuclease family protein [Desulfovibrio sp. OttesenSCG-928-G11]|nr:PD-(D/E)XK nuclease family protein [Desulfovibrio sp. OttesenSCG-928-G11]